MSPDPDDIDARFAELIRDEFGDEPLPEAHIDDSGVLGEVAPPPPKPEVFSFENAMESADPHPDEVFVMPDTLPPPRPWTGMRLTGALLLGLGLLILVAAVFGVQFESLITTLAGVSAVAGLIMLLLRVPTRRNGNGPWDNGARV